MSDIIITNKNISRFNKRLKKVLDIQFGGSIPLNLAASIFAQTLGAQDEHSLKIILDQTGTVLPATKNNNVESIVEYIFDYFKNNTVTNINSFTLFKEDDLISFNLTAPSSEFSDTLEGFGIYFGHPITYLETEFDRVVLSDKDKSFLSTLVEKLNFDDSALNLYLREKLKDLAGFDSRYKYASFEFKRSNIEEISNYGFVQKQFVLVPKNYFEPVGAPSTLGGDKYSFITLNNINVTYVPDVENSLSLLTDDNILIEFLRPLESKSNVINGLASYYLYREHNIIKARTMAGSVTKDILDITDYYTFIGNIYNEHRISRDHLLCKIAINAPGREAILLGFNSKF